ncbi:pyridoxamine 5'-phosphate oxidase family protein [Nocardiopsis sp. NPDC058789]|uniref:pyridoxamine 5'-phosphate oxidase family protein n=1 Tax=Nocardiopsis sp. NPDC058789 TaxID=3346634 RepID=UPI00366C1031
MAAYHSGELTVQRRAALTERAAVAEGALHTVIPDVAADFLATQRWLVAGTADARGRVWCSLLTGAPGFLRVRDRGTLDVDALPPPDDPLADVLGRGPATIGALALEPATRRRMRINGTSSPLPNGSGWRLRVAQVFANCPKYIQKRSPSPAPCADGAVVEGDGLTDAQANLVGRADTFFVATTDGSAGADANHRGGAPGFLRVHSPTLLSWPDYVGNAMFTTLGNLWLDSRAGLLVPDWESGGLLRITGAARVLWGAGPGDRTVEFTVHHVVSVSSGGLLSDAPPQYSKFNPPDAPAQ